MKTIQIFVIALFGFVLQAQTPVVSPATISGDGAAHAVTATAQRARWIIFIAPATNTTTNCGSGAISACPRVGDSNVSTSRGVPLPPGSSLNVSLHRNAGSECTRLRLELDLLRGAVRRHADYSVRSVI